MLENRPRVSSKNLMKNMRLSIFSVLSVSMTLKRATMNDVSRSAARISAVSTSQRRSNTWAATYNLAHRQKWRLC
jgi:hypothetical protein